MFNLFGNKKKQKQEALEKEQEKYEECVEKLLSYLHPDTRELLAKDYETFKAYVENQERSIPLTLLILMSKVDCIIDRLDSLEGDLSSTVEVDSSKTDTREVG